MGKAEKRREQRIALGKYFYDISKLTFAALVLGAVLIFFQAEEPETPVTVMLAFGIFATCAFSIIANNLNK
ncbi:MAG: hypothetical protein LBF55_05665 [Prevotellaceae bacterium]|jgi:hypothetical protein|nr:hypothetical protein [Prevotellaceae bacterium]